MKKQAENIRHPYNSLGVRRNIYEDVKIGVLTQGSILNGCIAEDFPNEEVYGFVITPRCALEHQGKVNTIHYVPIIPFHRWYKVIALPIIKERWKKELKDKINRLLEKMNLGTDVMGVGYSYEDMCLVLEEIKTKKDKQNLAKWIKSYYDKDGAAFKKYLKEDNKIGRGYLNELKGNKISSFYLIETWDKNNDSKYFVVLLRDIRRIKKDIADKIKNGINECCLAPEDFYHNDLFVSENKDNLFWVEAQMKSPFVEHVLQAFSHNFSQIGVEDIAQDTVEQLLESAQQNI